VGFSAIAPNIEAAAAMQALLTEIRQTPLLWMLVFVPTVLVAEAAAPHSPTLLFMLADARHRAAGRPAEPRDRSGRRQDRRCRRRIAQCHAWQSYGTIIAITALRAGQYMLVKASIGGAIVTNALFMLGACLLIGGLRYHVQEFNRSGGRLYSGLLLMATVALLASSPIWDFANRQTVQDAGGLTF
jgi:Ca2+:H+ antiporter